jgi:DNA-binding response OmpR family regulator
VRVLLIEEDRMLRRATERRMLIKAGYDLVSVSDGEEGLRAAGEATPA